MRQRAEEFAEGARRLSHALPDAALIDWNPYEEKSCLTELRKVRSDQFPPLLALAALRGEASRHFTHIFQNGTGIHRCILLSSKCILSLWHLTQKLTGAPLLARPVQRVLGGFSMHKAPLGFSRLLP
jgi:hypothetical protein